MKNYQQIILNAIKHIAKGGTIMLRPRGLGKQMNSGHFNYLCGCFMMIDKRGVGGGKSCDKCRNLQKQDAEKYTGLKQIECSKPRNTDERN